MATPIPQGLRLGVIEPADAVRNFDERQLLLPSFRWQDVWQEEHQRAFAVAGVMREDVLAIFRDGLEAKFAEGGTLEDSAARFALRSPRKGSGATSRSPTPTAASRASRASTTGACSSSTT